MIARVFQFFPRKIIFLHLSRKKKKKKKKRGGKKIFSGDSNLVKPISTSPPPLFHSIFTFISFYMHTYMFHNIQKKEKKEKEFIE